MEILLVREIPQMDDAIGNDTLLAQIADDPLRWAGSFGLTRYVSGWGCEYSPSSLAATVMTSLLIIRNCSASFLPTVPLEQKQPGLRRFRIHSLRL